MRPAAFVAVCVAAIVVLPAEAAIACDATSLLWPAANGVEYLRWIDPNTIPASPDGTFVSAADLAAWGTAKAAWRAANPKINFIDKANVTFVKLGTGGDPGFTSWTARSLRRRTSWRHDIEWFS